MNVFPTDLKIVEPDQLEISWSDEQIRRYTFRELRDNCPCATCREKRRAAESKPADLLPVLKAEETQPLKILAMKPLGSYAYSIRFSDNHDTGIYTYEHLLSLGETVERT